jgi:hypothetical protein
MAKEVAVRKRQLISKANQNMFIAIALVSIVLGFSIVGSIFLFQEMAFNTKVISEKNATIKVLESNNKAFPQLEQKIKALSNDDNLEKAMLGDDSDALRVIPDALPVTADNQAALGASLSDVLLNVDGIIIESIRIGQGSSYSSSTSSSSSKKGVSAIEFSVAVSGSADNIKKIIENLEKSIRTIDITTAKFTYGGKNLTLSIMGTAYYSYEVTSELKEKEVRP